jgi:hypothetical protein
MVKTVDAHYDHARGINDDHTQWTETLDAVDEDLTGVQGLTLTVIAPDGSKPLDATSATAVDADTVGYTFDDSDLTQQGSHQAFFSVNFSDGSSQRVPNNGNYLLQVVPDGKV